MVRAPLHPLAIMLAVTALACSDPAPAPTGDVSPFPSDFRWGTATAGFHVDMGCPTLVPEACEDRASDWYTFITAPETMNQPFMEVDPPSWGPGHWELFEDDFELAQGIGHNAFRTSIEWSRIFPTATDDVEDFEALRNLADPVALERYHQMFDAMAARGLEPMITLSHYTLPTWIHDVVGCHEDLDACSLRGWLDKERTLREITKFSAFVAREFGGQVDLWVTLNEPMAVVVPSYLFPQPERANPPAVLLRFAEARQVLVTLIEANARMYDALEAGDTVDADGDGEASVIGLVHAYVPFGPKDPDSELDQQAVRDIDYLFNTVFLEGAIRGQVDEELDGNIVRREDVAGRADFLGINYYTRALVEGTRDPTLAPLSPFTHFNLLATDFSQVYPDALYDAAMLSEGYGLPMWVTESGTMDLDNAVPYLVQHVDAIARALRDGADVRGYYWASLTDFYDWNHGMKRKYGLFAVDPLDPAKQRVARPAADVYRRISEANDVPADLLEAHTP